MRYSPEHKAETHARIVRKASVRLRERGAHGVGVADLMKEAGLTHGGFYAHFDSREALVVEAFGYAIDRSMEHWRKLLDQLPPQKRLAAIVDGYLSAGHRDDVGHGCAVPALGAEIARESAKTRKAFAAKLEELIDLFAEYIVDVPARTARKRASAMLATLTGTLVMARLTGSGELSDDILNSGREVALAVASGGGPAGKAPARAPANRSAKKTAAAKR
ncbi:TetR/AcrR family transcriptional regulator [Bradyrhizobium oligotrophicum]|uniref:TetR/AcrR family transcriptional regulator n=1 Tax=Bradyrhizobium oligotrophicum TaxID=44255 RepID=UPI003EBC208C